VRRQDNECPPFLKPSDVVRNQMKVPFILILIAVALSCGNNNHSNHKNSENNDSIIHEQQLTQAYNASGKGLYQNNCSSCHNIFNTVDERPFAEIVKSRTTSWTYKLITDTTFVQHDSVRKTLGQQVESHIQFPSLSKQNVDSIWRFIINLQNKADY
jgi:hypothetical protein